MEDLLAIPRDGRLEFPLPAAALPDVKLTANETKYYRATAATITDATVAMEREFRVDNDGLVDMNEWKLATTKDGLRVYKRATRPSKPDSDERSKRQPMVLCVGSMPGTVEQALYGMHAETSDELRAVSSIVSKNHMDMAVLNVMDRGTRNDPLRLLTLKWRIYATPGGDLFKNRDMVTLESMGIAIDAHGERFGHILLKSVERPELPHFSKDVAVRSTLAFCCIFRQVTSDTVAIYAKGVFDLGGDISDWFCYTYACPRMAGILDSSLAMTAKQVTALAIKNSRAFSRMRNAKLDSLGSGSSVSSVSSSEDADEDKSSCAVCQRRGGSWRLLRSSAQRCQICERYTCSKCLVKQELLATPANIHVRCCTACVLEAKALPIRSNALCPMLRQ